MKWRNQNKLPYPVIHLDELNGFDVQQWILPYLTFFASIPLEHKSLLSLSVYGKVSQISAIYLFLCVFYAMLRYKSFKIRVNCVIELIKIYENMVLTNFLDLF